MKPDRSKLSGLFELNIDLPESSQAFSNKPSLKSPKTRIPPKSKPFSEGNNKFQTKLSEGLFNSFDKKDWVHYFIYKASTQGIVYKVGHHAREQAIMQSLAKDFTATDVKDMIDFIFDSTQDVVDKRTVGIWVLSKGWINTIYQNALLWKSGTYVSKKDSKGNKWAKPVRNREWVSEDKPPEKKRNSITI